MSELPAACCPPCAAQAAPRNPLQRFGEALGLGSPEHKVGRARGERRPPSRCSRLSAPRSAAAGGRRTPPLPAAALLARSCCELARPASTHVPRLCPPPACPQDFDSPVKATDFGLSIRHRPEDPPLKSRSGTPAYMAPEVGAGQRALWVRWPPCLFRGLRLLGAACLLSSLMSSAIPSPLPPHRSFSRATTSGATSGARAS